MTPRKKRSLRRLLGVACLKASSQLRRPLHSRLFLGIFLLILAAVAATAAPHLLPKKPPVLNSFRTYDPEATAVTKCWTQQSRQDYLFSDEKDRVSKALNEYRQLHARTMDPKDRGPKKFLIVSAGKWGLGNRMAFVTQALQVAIFTQRAIIIHRFQAVAGDSLFDHPINCTWSDLERLVSAWPPELGAMPPPPVTTSADDGHWDAEWALCTDFLADTGVYMYAPPKPTHPFFSVANPHQREYLADLYGTHVLYYLTSWFFRPSSAVQSAVDDFLKSNPGGIDVGLHVRTGHSWDFFMDDPKKDIDLAWTSLKMMIRGCNDQARVFLATDSKAVLDEGKSIFGSRVVHRSRDKIRPDGGQFDAVVDMVILSRARVFVGTLASTFSYWVHATSLHVPFYVDYRRKRTAFRLPSSQSGLFFSNRWKPNPIWPISADDVTAASCFEPVMLAQVAEVFGEQ